MTLTSSAQTTLLEGRSGNLTLRLVVQKNELRLKRLVKISTRTATRSSPVATYFGECRYLSISTVNHSYPYYSSSTYVVNCINTIILFFLSLLLLLLLLLLFLLNFRWGGRFESPPIMYLFIGYIPSI